MTYIVSVIIDHSAFIKFTLSAPCRAVHSSTNTTPKDPAARLSLTHIR